MAGELKSAGRSGSWLSRHPLAAGVTAGVVLLVAGLILATSLGGAKATLRQVYYYDMQTGKLFAGLPSQIMPILVPGGNADDKASGVRAYVFACGDCGNEAERFVGWLESHDPRLVKQFQSEEKWKGTKDEFMLTVLREEGGILVRDAKEGSAWFAQTAPEAQALMKAVEQRCGEGKKLATCVP